MILKTILLCTFVDGTIPFYMCADVVLFTHMAYGERNFFSVSEYDTFHERETK